MSWQEDCFQRFYGGRKDWIGGTTEFHNLCRRHIPDKSTVLEIGAGPSNPTSAFLSRISMKLIGLDIDEEVKGNQFLADAYTYDGRQFPFADETFDAAVCDYVMEHVEFPSIVCSQISRVLTPGGIFIFRTPNIYHYVPMLSRFLPMHLSTWARGLSIDSHDPYPTYYKFNSRTQCNRILTRTGFKLLGMFLVEKEPSYGMKSKWMFFPMMIYERFVNSLEIFSFLRVNIFGAAIKPK